MYWMARGPGLVPDKDFKQIILDRRRKVRSWFSMAKRKPCGVPVRFHS